MRTPTGGCFCRVHFRERQIHEPHHTPAADAGLSLAPVPCWAAEPKAEEAKAIAEIESIDYSHPGIYREFPDSLGDRTAIRARASTLKGESDADTIRNVLLWMDQNLNTTKQKPTSGGIMTM